MIGQFLQLQPFAITFTLL